MRVSPWFALVLSFFAVAACGGITTQEGSGGDDDDSQRGAGGTATGGGPSVTTTGGALMATGGTFGDEFERTMDAYCSAATAAGCDYDEPSCLEDLRSLVAASVERGCPVSLLDSMLCGIGAGLECGAHNLPHPPFEPCQPTLLDLSYCLGDSLAFPELCAPWTSSVDGSVECGADCIAFGMVCETPGACACTHGPLAGEQFPFSQACSDPVAVAVERCWLAGV